MKRIVLGLVAVASTGIVGCGSAEKSSSSPPVGVAPLARGCPPVAELARAPAKRARSGGVFTLGEMVPREQDALPWDGPPLRANIGVVHAAPFEPRGVLSVRGTARFPDLPLFLHVRPAIEPPFRRWRDSAEGAAAASRTWTLLERRIRMFASATAEHPPDPVERDCVIAAMDRTNEDVRMFRATMSKERAELMAALQLLGDRTGGENLLLAQLRFDGLVAASGESMDAVKDLHGVWRARAFDDAESDEVRVRAAYELARDGRVFDGPIDGAFRLLVERSNDARLELPARYGLALLGKDSAVAEAALEEIAPQFEASTDPTLRSRAAEVYADLGAVCARRQDTSCALRAWSKCLATREVDEDDDDDPLLCAPPLANLLVHAGGAQGPDASIEVPVELAARVGLHVASGAIAAWNRGVARRALRIAAERAPDATDAPRVLSLLAGIASDPADARRARDRRNTEFAVGSPWFLRERSRAAASGGDVELKLLLAPLPVAIAAEPSTEDEWLVELRDRRANAFVAFGCSWGIPTFPRATVRIDTRGSTPSVTRSGEAFEPSAAACLERSAQIYFRSLPPAEITLTLVH